MAMTAQASWRLGPPLQAGIVYAHNSRTAIAARSGEPIPIATSNRAQDVDELIRTTTSGHIAGIIAEPIQGVGGFITPAARILRHRRRDRTEVRRSFYQ